MNGVASLPRRRWLLIALVGSVAINAFLLGLIATDIIREHGGHSDGPRSLSFELRWLEGRLPSDGFDKVADAVAAARPAAEAHIEKLQQLRQGLGELAAVPQPDRAAIDARLAEIRGELSTMVAELQKTAMDALLALPEDMRAKLASPAPDQK